MTRADQDDEWHPVVGAHAWAPHGERAWIAVKVVSIEGRRARVHLVLESGRPSHAAERLVPRELLQPRDPRRWRADRPPGTPGETPPRGTRLSDPRDLHSPDPKG